MITLQQYIEIQKLQKKYKDDADALGIALITLLSGKDVNAVTIEEGEKIIKHVGEEMKDLDKLPFVHKFKMDGVEFGFIPNLEDISVGEFIDLDSLMKQDELPYAEIMSVLYRPIKRNWFKSYNIEAYTGSDKYNELFLKTDFKIIIGALFFFAILRSSLYNHITTYTPQMMKSPQKEEV